MCVGMDTAPPQLTLHVAGSRSNEDGKEKEGGEDPPPGISPSKELKNCHATMSEYKCG